MGKPQSRVPDRGATARNIAAALRQLELDVDTLIEQSLVQLLRASDDKLVGTGFLISPRIVLTCDHVADSGEPLVAVCGQERTPLGLPGHRCHGLDLALYRIPRAIGPVLAVGGSFQAQGRLRGRTAAEPRAGYAGSAPFVLEAVGQANFRHRGPSSTPIIGLDLEGSGVGPGSSGSPLVAESQRSAVAFIVGGNDDIEKVWGVRVADASKHFPALSGALRINDHLSARYGQAINALGAQTLFAMAAEVRRDALSREQRFVAKQDVPRLAMLRWLDAFGDAHQPLMAIVGPSNVGKSWALAAWSLKTVRSEIRILLEARTLGAGAKPLEVLLTEQLSDALHRRLPDRADERLVPQAQRLSHLIASTKLRLVVVLDAINEAPEWEDFSARWLPQAAAWCDQHGVRLVMSCREESWTTMVGAARLSCDRFFVPKSIPQPTRDIAMTWCLRLGDFDDDEARAAAKQYGIAESDSPGNHPLMFRIARSLGSSGSGRLQLLKRYVDDRIARVGSRHRMADVQRKLLTDAITRIADLLPPSGEGGAPLADVLPLVNDPAVLQSLVDEGILSCSATHVRFRFDQLADTLRTIVPGALLGFHRSLQDPGKPPGTDDITAATITLLRLEGEHESGDFRRGIDLLVAAIKRSADTNYPDEDLMAGADRIARSLPERRSDDVRAIYLALVKYGNQWRELVDRLENAGLPAVERAMMLLDYLHAKRTFDGTGYPMRWKDWQDADRRNAFVQESVRESGVALAALRRLVRTHESVFDVIWRGMQDERRIGAEASVASACSGLLFLESESTSLLEKVVQRLLWPGERLDDADVSVYGESTLGHNLVIKHLPEVAPLLRTAWERGNTSDALVRMLSSATDCGSELFWPAVVDLFMRMRDLPSRRSSTKTLARLLRKRDPEEVDGWDVLTRSWTTYDAYGPIPSRRLDEAIDRIPKEGIGFAECVISRHVGTIEQQRPLVRAVLRALAIEHARGRLGYFVEQHLDLLEPHLALQRPWLALALKIVRASDRDYRVPLVFRAFSSVETRWAERIRRLLVDSPVSSEWHDTIGSIATWETPDETWGAWYRRAQRHNPDDVDRKAWQAILENALRDEMARYARRLVNHWRAELDPSPFARSILSRLDAGTELSELFDQDPERSN